MSGTTFQSLRDEVDAATEADPSSLIRVVNSAIHLLNSIGVTVLVDSSENGSVKSMAAVKLPPNPKQSSSKPNPKKALLSMASGVFGKSHKRSSKSKHASCQAPTTTTTTNNKVDQPAPLPTSPPLLSVQTPSAFVSTPRDASSETVPQSPPARGEPTTLPPRPALRAASEDLRPKKSIVLAAEPPKSVAEAPPDAPVGAGGEVLVDRVTEQQPPNAPESPRGSISSLEELEELPPQKPPRPTRPAPTRASLKLPIGPPAGPLLHVTRSLSNPPLPRSGPIEPQGALTQADGATPNLDTSPLPNRAEGSPGEPDWIKMQRKTFTRWANSHLKKRDIELVSLEEDISDGCALIALLEILSEKKLPKAISPARMPVQEIQNLNHAFKFMKTEGIVLVNISPEDICGKNTRLVLGLIWTLIQHYEINIKMESQPAKEKDPGGPKGQLLAWCNSILPIFARMKVYNFSSSWRDGGALQGLLRYLRSRRGDALDPLETQEIPQSSWASRSNEALQHLESEFGVSRLLDGEDVAAGPDELSMVAYVTLVYNVATATPPDGGLTVVTNTAPVKISWVSPHESCTTAFKIASTEQSPNGSFSTTLEAVVIDPYKRSSYGEFEISLFDASGNALKQLSHMLPPDLKRQLPKTITVPNAPCTIYLVSLDKDETEVSLAQVTANHAGHYTLPESLADGTYVVRVVPHKGHQYVAKEKRFVIAIQLRQASLTIDLQPRHPAYHPLASLTTFEMDTVDSHGNASDRQLIVPNGLKGAKMAFLVLSPPTYERYKCLQKAIDSLGMEFHRFFDFNSVVTHGLDSFCQLWIISGHLPTQLTERDLHAISDFAAKGNGLYIWADNYPYIVEANLIADRLLGITFFGNVPGQKKVGRTVSYGNPGFVPHPIFTGLSRLFEGVTIATVKLPDNQGPNSRIFPLMWGSLPNLVTAGYMDKKRCGMRILVDGGYTRLWDSNWGKVGTSKFVQNCAGWLANLEHPRDSIKLVKSKFDSE